MSEGDSRWAAEMVRIVRQTGQITARGAEAFFDPANAVEFGAARMLIIDLGVAAKKLSDDFKDAHPDIEWKLLARARDKYAHHYENIDREVVWNLLTGRLVEMGRILGG